MDKIKKDPLTMDYARRQWQCLKSKTSFEIGPIDGIAEKRCFAASLSLGHGKVFSFSKNTHSWELNKEFACDEKKKREMFLGLSIMLMSAEVVFFEHNMMTLLNDVIMKFKSTYEEIAKSGQQLPQARKWPFPLAWVTTKTGINMECYISGDSSKKGSIGVDGMLLGQIDGFDDMTGYAHIYLSSDEDGINAYRQQTPQSFSDAFSFLLEEKIVRIEKKRPPNWQRKKAEQLGFRGDNYVNIISLRSTLGTEHARLKKKNESDLEYYHRWIVRGHLRNQFYPSKNCHEIIWIDPYAKGPEDKPFKEHVYNVIR